MQPPHCRIRSYLVKSSGKSFPATTSTSISPPTFFLKRFGIFSRPISSSSGACEQLSATSTFAPVFRSVIAFAPSTYNSISPLYAAKSTENEVSRLSAGLSSYTLSKTWESVMMSLGAFLSSPKASLISSGATHMILACLSSSSRSVVTWGSISLPFGACLSCGITHITRSPALTRLPSIDGSGRPPAIRMISFFSSSIPKPVTGLTRIMLIPLLASSRPDFSNASFIIFSVFSILSDDPLSICSCVASDPKLLSFSSACPITGITGTFFFWKNVTMFISISISSPKNTMTAISHSAATLFVRSSRCPPSSVSSPSPAVSVRRHGPIGDISIAL